MTISMILLSMMMRQNHIKIKNPTTAGYLICTLAAVFYCYEYMLRMEPSIMVSELMHEFQVNATQFGMLSAVFYFI